jgi:hypothetical protein
VKGLTATCHSVIYDALYSLFTHCNQKLNEVRLWPMLIEGQC